MAIRFAGTTRSLLKTAHQPFRTESLLNHPLIIPNLHVILVHYPLGLISIGLLIELGAFLWPTHPVRAAGRWMIFLGGLSMIPASLSGIYALHDVAITGNASADGTWAEVMKGTQLSADQWQELVRHVWLMSIASGVIVLAIIAFVAASDRLRLKLHWAFLVLLLAGVGTEGVGAWFAGEAIYRLGVAVEKPDLVVAASQPAEQRSILAQINVLFPPMQNHIVVAGYAIAIALAAVGLSIRKITADYVEPVRMSESDSLLHSFNPPVERPAIYAAKFWMAGMTAFILTALLGWFFLASEAGTFNPKALWSMAMANPDGTPGFVLMRTSAHVIAASSLVLLPLIMAGLAKWAPKQKILLGVFTLLLLAVIAAQLWIGILLLFDGSTGKLTGFN